MNYLILLSYYYACNIMFTETKLFSDIIKEKCKYRIQQILYHLYAKLYPYDLFIFGMY